MRTVAIINQKGGCGKTTTAINLAAVLARRGLRVLLADLDPQSHCAAGLGIPERKIERHIGDAMLADDHEPLGADRLLWRVARNLDLAPSTMKLAGLEAIRGGLANMPDKERRLLKALERLDEHARRTTGQGYDLCLIDCPPSIGLLTYNALAASRDIIIPVESSYFALSGAAKQINTVRSIARRLDIRIRSRLVPTLFDPESPLARDLIAETRRRYERNLCPHSVRFDAKLREAASLGQPVIDYDARSTGAQDYQTLADWLITHVGLDSAAEPEAFDDLDQALDLGSLDDVFRRAEGPARLLAELREDLEHGLPPRRDDAPNAPVQIPAGLRPDAEPQTGFDLRPGDDRSGPADLKPQILSRHEELIRRAEQMRRDRAASAASPAAAALAGGVALQPRVLARSGSLELVDDRPIPTRPEEGVQRLFGVRVTARGVLFVQPLALGDRISVVGDFNGWSPDLDVMQRNERLGVHELLLDIEPGNRQYKLVVDERWVIDPYNPRTAPNQYGEANSLVTIPAR